MGWLLGASFIWALSPGLIKGRLAGLDGATIAAVRLGLALLVFLPWLRLRGVGGALAGQLAAIGAVQFGLMYLAYNESFRYLQSHEIALFTITTPIFVTLFADLLDRTVRGRALAAALLAVAGAAVLSGGAARLQVTLKGLALVQLSNLAFAVGQVLYRRVRAKRPGPPDHQIFALLYAGAFAVSLVAWAAHGAPAAITPAQGWTLLYLGAGASGLAFFLWNVGATRVGSGTLAVMNNAKIPLMILGSLVVFGEQANLARLALSLALMAGAVWLADRK